MNKRYLREVFAQRIAEAGDLDKYKKVGSMPDVNPSGIKVRQRPYGMPPGKEPKIPRYKSAAMPDEPHQGSERSPGGIWVDKKKAGAIHRGYEKHFAKKGQEYDRPDPLSWPKNIKGWEKHMRAIGKNPDKMEPPPHDEKGNIIHGDTGTTRDPSSGVGGMPSEPMTAPTGFQGPSDIAGTHGVGGRGIAGEPKKGLAAKPKLKMKMGKRK